MSDLDLSIRKHVSFCERFQGGERSEYRTREIPSATGNFGTRNIFVCAVYGKEEICASLSFRLGMNRY